MARLGDICRFQSGGTPSKNEPTYFNGTIPWITTVALNGNIIDADDAVDWITEKAIAESAAKIVPAHSIMVGTRVGVGKVAINAAPMSTNQDIISLIGIDENRWSKSYLCKFISGQNEFLNTQARGATIRGIKIDVLAELNIPDISLSEQRHIAAVLDKVSGMIALRKQQLAKLDELVKARFVELFGEPETNTKGWPISNMGNLCSVGSSKRIYQSEQSSVGIPFWRVSDLTNLINTGVATENLYIPEKRYAELQAQGQVPVKGDILITSRGTLGQCYIVKATDRFYFQDGMISWLSEYADSITPLYISHLFSMPGFQKQIDSMQAGSTVAYLSIAMIKKLKVMIPDAETQQQFATFVEQIDQCRLTIQRGLDKLEMLKKALMQEYFGR